MDYRAAILSELENIDCEVGLVETLIRKSESDPLDEIEIRAAALSLSTIYNGIEKVITFALKDRGVEIPGNGNWHTKLLELGADHALIEQKHRSDLLGFLAFRHFIRHAYSFEIDADAITEIIRKCPALTRSFSERITSLYR